MPKQVDDYHRFNKFNIIFSIIDKNSEYIGHLLDLELSRCFNVISQNTHWHLMLILKE
ncbi:hypothetical protein AO369_1954 [Moraxella catarrhalis]|nr:hypothetical protein AO369_1954 [Moraxella catarrhalis]